MSRGSFGPLRPALALASSLVAALAPLLAAADISFAEPRLLPAGFHATGGAFIGAASGDFDGDGNLDVAATAWGLVPLLSTGEEREHVAVWLGNGDATFQAPVHADLGPRDAVGVAGIAAADLDRDGKLDLAVAAWRQQKVLVLLGRGDGTFGQPAAFDAGVMAGSLQVADLDGDGNADLATVPAVVDPSATQVAVLRGDGLGGLGAPTLHTVGRFPADLVLADADGKNGLDVLVACNAEGQLSVLLNDGHGSFPAAAPSYPVRIDARGLWAGDFDGDGKLDVVVAGLLGTYADVCGGGCIVTVHGNGDGTFTAPPAGNVRVTGPWPSRFYVAGSQAPDLNGDGRPDAFFLRAEGDFAFNEVTVMLSEPSGGHSLAEWVASPGLPVDGASRVDGMGTSAAVAGDFDRDGAPDLVVATIRGTGSATFSLLPGVPGRPGTFRAPRLASLTRGWAWTRGLALGRLDGGDTLDVLAITDALDAVPGNGDGTLGAAFPALARVAGPGEFYNTLRTADLNGDGKLDALWLATDGVQGGPPPRHLVSLGAGDGTFQLVAGLPAHAGFAGENAAIADFDGDGIPDLAVLAVAVGGVVPYVQAQVEIWKNDGLGTAGSFTLLPVVDVQPGGVFASSPGFAAADLDGDGHPDLVAHRFNAAGGDDLLFLEGNGDGTFGAPQVVGSDLGGAVSDVAVADANEDGKLDVVLARGSYATVLLGNGDGTFQPRAGGSDVASGIGTVEVRVADLDGDGHLDLVVGATNGPAFHRGDGRGGFGPPHHLAVGCEASGLPFEVGDLDGDGRPDLVAGHPTGEAGVGPSFDYLTVLRNDSGPRADLAVSLSGAPSPVHVAEALTWTIAVSNLGPDAAAGVTVRDPLRLGATYLSASPSQGSCAQAGGAVTCSLGPLAAGASATVAVRVTPVGPGPGAVWNTASSTSATVDPDTADNAALSVASVLPASADLALTASDAPDPVTAGANLTYTFVATNHGPSAATAVTFADPLPAGASFVSAAASAGSCTHAAGTVTCAIGALASGAQAEVAVVVTPQSPGDLANTGSVSAAEGDPEPANDSAQARTVVQAPARKKRRGCGCGEPGGSEALLAAILLATAWPGRGGRKHR
ncbi:MAG TPA: FG-GAP-like repeat-containing protein [Anaeromyxobacteraceae bacterium]